MKAIEVTLGDVVEQIRGVTYNKNDAKKNPDHGLIPILRANNIFEDSILYEDLIYVPKKCVNPKQLIKKHDIIIAASSGSKEVVGKSGYINSDWVGSFGAFCKLLRPKPIIDPLYLRFYFTTPEYRQKISNLSEGANINNLRNEHLNNLVILLPPLDDQQRIATILDHADSVHRKNLLILEKYNELAQSVFYEMFGDPMSNSKNFVIEPLYKLGKLISGGTPTRKEPKYFSGSIPWVTTTALGKKYIGLADANELITTEALNNSATKLIPKGSIMIGARVGIGKASILSCDMCGSQDILSLINISNDVNKIYLLDVMRLYEKYFQSQRRGATIQGITSGTIKSISIPIPQLKLQNAYSELIKNIEKQKELTRMSLDKSEDLFQSLLQRAFKGEL